MKAHTAYLKHDDGKYYKHILIRSKDMEDFNKQVQYEEVQADASIDTLTSTLNTLEKEVATLESTLSETSEKRIIVRNVLSTKLNHKLDELGLTTVDFNIHDTDLIVELPANEVKKTPPL